MGGGASLRERQGGNVWGIVRGRNAISCGDRQAAAPCGHLPQCYRVELPRWLDVPGRRLRAVVQRIVDHRTGGEHYAAARGVGTERDRGDAKAAAERLSHSA